MIAAAVAAYALYPRESPAPAPESSDIRPYEAITDLVRGATAIVEVTPTGNASTEPSGPPEEPNVGAPWLFTEVEIDRVIAGTLMDPAAKTMVVRGFKPTSPAQPTLKKGAKYVLFVYPFLFEVGKPTGDYYITGEYAGLFELNGSDVKNLDTEPTALAAVRGLEEIESAASRAAASLGTELPYEDTFG